ncbi:MAG: enolase C-terminal domain-like protein [Bacteroidia bacterium]|nr:enolase C-terminal domain-like protein [Bacteroidia bacterium]
MNLSRRNILKTLGLGAAGALAFSPMPAAAADKYRQATVGLKPIKITNVKAIATAPQNGIELIVVKVETSEPGLYGLGCATFRQRAHSVVVAIDKYLNDFCMGKDPDNIEDIWQTAYVSSYWRNGPVLNNALSGLDQALWDIKGKRAGMPVYQLLGGKCRFGVDCYAHASGNSVEAVVESAQKHIANGFRHVRIQMGGYGAAGVAQTPDFKNAGFGLGKDNYMDSFMYMKSVREIFDGVRKACGEEVELLHDIHERLTPIDGINLVMSLEQYRPFFIEDPFAPEDMGYFKLLRQKTAVPLAMGELFNSPHEWVGPMTERLFDFIRIHISQIGGITPAMKVARLGEWFNIRTAWHGPGDVSPVGHAANAHIDFAIWNFGIQESVNFNEQTLEVFPGSPYVKDGFMYVNDTPGLGVDINEKAAAKYPIPDKVNTDWTQLRKNDGTPVRP